MAREISRPWRTDPTWSECRHGDSQLGDSTSFRLAPRVVRLHRDIGLGFLSLLEEARMGGYITRFWSAGSAWSRSLPSIPQLVRRLDLWGTVGLSLSSHSHLGRRTAGPRKSQTNQPERMNGVRCFRRDYLSASGRFSCSKRETVVSFPFK